MVILSFPFAFTDFFIVYTNQAVNIKGLLFLSPVTII